MVLHISKGIDGILNDLEKANVDVILFILYYLFIGLILGFWEGKC